MDSAKNRKSFPDFATEGESTVARDFAVYGRPTPEQFSLPTSFWDAIQRDPELRAEYERRVESRAKELLEADATPQKQQIFDQARKDGFEQGVQEGRKQLQECQLHLENIAKQVIAEKVELLHQHEGIWVETVGHLMKRFLVPQTKERLANLKKWLEEAIGDLSRQAKIQVALAPSVMSEVKAITMAEETSHWDWVEDRSLNEMEIRVNLLGGGLLFSPQAELAKLEEKLKEVLESKPT